MVRVQENQERLREFGVKNIASSLTSLVESQNTKKRRVKSSITNERDREYIPDGGDSDEDYHEEVAINNKVPTQQHRTQYIAPRSITRYTTLAKKNRVVAPNMSHMLPFEEACKQNGQSVDSSITTKRGLQQYSEKSHEGHKQSRDLNAAKHSKSSATSTMGELILKKKMPQMVIKQNVEKENSTTTSISCGARRKLIYIDKDDDRSYQDVTEARCLQDHVEVYESEDMDNMIFGKTQKRQTKNGLGSQGLQDHVEVDENEDMDNLIFGNIQNQLVGNGLGSQDGNDFETEQYGVGDDENGEADQILFENNEIEEDDIEDDLENEANEANELAQEQLQHSRSLKNAAISTTRKRGPTMLHGLQVRNINEREVIICNKYGQPIGPQTEEKDTVGKFSRFLGTIARNYSYAPLTYTSWHKVPKNDKEKMWQFVLKKYIVPDDARTWVLMTIGACWRGHKSRVKRNHLYKYKENKSRWKNRPEEIPAKDFSQLLSLWSSKNEMHRCLQLRNTRALQKNMHTAGPKSFARIREEMKNEDPNKESPKQTQMFERTRQRREGNIYVDTYDDTEMKIELMKNYKPPEEEEIVPQDPYLAVMSKDYNGHRRLYGKGVTNKLINKVNGGEGSYMVPREIMESLKVGVDIEGERTRLDDMRREFEAFQERKKAELEAMKKDIDNQRDKIVEDAVQKLIQKLPPGVSRDIFM